MRAPRSAVAGVLLSSCLAGISPSRRPPAAPAPASPAAAAIAPAAAVGWPPSAGLLVAEVVTGGTSASDEYVEITNAGPAAAGPRRARGRLRHALGCDRDPQGRVGGLAPGRARAPRPPGERARDPRAAADATYSGGLAATGGAIVLRRADGQVVDAVGWGDASSGFVEGIAAPARRRQAARSSADPAATAGTWSTRTTTRPTGSRRPPRCHSRSRAHRSRADARRRP